MKGFLRKYHLPLMIVLVLLAAVFPLAFRNEAVLTIAVKVLIYMIIATGLNISNGYIGLFNLSSAAFMAIGAYTAGLFYRDTGVPFFLALIIAAAFTAVIGAVFAIPTNRVQGFYFSVITLGFSEVVRLLALNWKSLTNGSMGIRQIPLPVILGIKLSSSRAFYYFVLIVLVCVLISVRRIISSRVGRAWMAIRENQDAAKSLGISSLRYKSLNFATMGFLMGFGGGLLATYYRFIAPDMFSVDIGHQVLAMVNLGGLSTIAGPVLGAVLVTVSMEVFRFASQYRMIAYALIVILTMWIRPQGIIGQDFSKKEKSAAADGKKGEENRERTT